MPTANGSNTPATVSRQSSARAQSPRRYGGQVDGNGLLTSYAEARKQMNLYPSGDDPGGPLAPAEWTMRVTQEGMGERSYFVLTYFEGGSRCADWR